MKTTVLWQMNEGRKHCFVDCEETLFLSISFISTPGSSSQTVKKCGSLLTTKFVGHIIEANSVITKSGVEVTIKCSRS